MPDFYLPYNFYPVTGKINGEPGGRREYDFANDKPATDSARALARHDLYQKGRLHGRLICSLVLKSPAIIGNVHTDTHPAKVQPYYWRNEVAIPANTLRGMIASIMETLSQSSLRVLDREFWKVFADIDDILPPWSPSRKELSAAELILGAAEEIPKGQAEKIARNLASRVRFHDAVQWPPLIKRELDNDTKHPWVSLKELGSPKPTEIPDGHNANAPSNYFRYADTGDEITKSNAISEMSAESGKVRPNGRKFYLPHRAQGTENYRLEHANNVNMLMQVKPIGEGLRFHFHIDFTNLTEDELGLLLTALAPGNNFTHKIGLGKSLGLGATSVTPEALFFSDPVDRYGTNALNTGAYQAKITFNNRDGNGWKYIPGYAREEKALCDPLIPEKEPPRSTDLIDQNTLQLLIKVGDSNNLKGECPVRWRRGHAGEDPNALPLSSLDEPMPDYYSAPPPAEEIADSPLTGDDEAARWIRDAISQILGQDFSKLDPEEVDDALKGRRLRDLWRAIGDLEGQRRIHELLLTMWTERALTVKNAISNSYVNDLKKRQ